MSRARLSSVFLRAFNTQRHYSTPNAARTSPLAILRRKTGYPFNKCKEALTKHDNNVEIAEQYLRDQAQKEGWAKAEKVSGRVANHGLVGVAIDGNKGLMIEVNCETDFVSKNPDFRKLVAEITETTLSRYQATEGLPIHHMPPSSIPTLEHTGGNIADLVAKNIGHFGENIVIARGCLAIGDDNKVLGSFVYNGMSVPDSGVEMGTYASLVLLEATNDRNRANVDEIKNLGFKIGQHIVGMAPSSVVAGGNEEGECLVNQSWILDNSVTAGEWLQSHDVHVTDFARYGLGDQ